MKNLESKIYDVLKEAGVPVKQAKKMAKKTAQKAEFFIWEKKQGEDKNGIPKKETELDRAVDKVVDAAIDAVSDSKLGKLLDENMAELFGPEMGKMISRVENKVDDSVITPRPKAGVVTRLKMNLCSPSLSVSESGNEELCSELSPSLVEADKRSRKAECSTPQGLTNDDKVGVQSVDGVSDNSPLPARYHTTGECSPYDGSQYTSSNHQTDGQPEVGRGLPSIDEDGTAKKKTKDLPPWKFSKTCQRNKARVRELYRRKAEYTKCQHETLLNSMIKDSSIFINEPMDFKALAKKARETKRRDKASVIKNADGTEKTVYKYKRKKRFGKSITDRSPSFLIARLKQKCEQYGMIYLETDKWKYKASQYNHVLDDYIKTALSERFKNIGAITVQRDLYSAFLQSCMDTVEKPDRKKCIQLFDNFVKMQNDLITEMKVSGKSYPACFGF